MGLMRRFLVSALLLSVAVLVFAGSDTASSGVCSQTPDPADIEEVRRLELRGARVNTEGWSLEEARAFFAPTFVSVGPDGNVAGLDSVLTGFAGGRLKPWAKRFDLVELDIRVYGAVAIVIGLAEAEWIGAPDGTKPIRFRFLNVWRKVGGRWLYSEQQFTRFQPK